MRKWILKYVTVHENIIPWESRLPTADKGGFPGGGWSGSAGIGGKGRSFPEEGAGGGPGGPGGGPAGGRSSVGEDTDPRVERVVPDEGWAVTPGRQVFWNNKKNNVPFDLIQNIF